MVEPVGIDTTCVCMQASQRLSTAHVQVNPTWAKPKAKGGKETARKKKEKERTPPLFINHHKDYNILLSVVVNSYKNK